ncbi:MAG: CHASE2 domain-containing protein, partial [Halanaerobiales bacterium]
IIFNNFSSQESDREFINTLIKYDNVVLPVVPDLRQRIGVYNNIEVFDISFEKPYQAFSDNAILGHIYLITDRDGIIRKFYPIMSADDYHTDYYKSFALQLVESAGFWIPQPIKETGGNEDFLISFSGHSNSIPTVSFYELIKGEFNPSFFKNKIVVIGVNARGAGDRYMTPFSRYGAMAGSEIHVQIISSIIQGNLKKRVPYIVDFMIYIVTIIMINLTFVRYNPFKATIILCVFWFIYTILYLVLFMNNLIIVYTAEAFLVLMIYIISLIIWYVTVNREKAEIINAFEHYISPGVMNKLMKNPSEITLGGEKTELSVMFLDIRNFTSYAEERSPEEVVGFLNEAFEKITTIIFGNEGTLDKYLGDGLMAFFGAPLEMRNHHERVLKTAQELMNLNLPFEIGIGINSGQVVAGNVGSRNRLEYTVIGDVVNKAARFVDIAGPGEIVIGLETYNALSEEKRNLNWNNEYVDIKGSARKIEIYRL